MDAEALAIRLTDELLDGDAFGGHFSAKPGSDVVTIDGYLDVAALAAKILEWLDA